MGYPKKISLFSYIYIDLWFGLSYSFSKWKFVRSHCREISISFNVAFLHAWLSYNSINIIVIKYRRVLVILSLNFFLFFWIDSKPRFQFVFYNRHFSYHWVTLFIWILIVLDQHLFSWGANNGKEYEVCKFGCYFILKEIFVKSVDIIINYISNS